MPPHIVRYPPIQCNTRERCDQLQIPAPPPAWRVPEGPDNLAAAPMGGGRAWPGFEGKLHHTQRHKRRRCGGRRRVRRARLRHPWAAAGPGRASRRRAERSSRRGRLAGGPPPTGTPSSPATRPDPTAPRTPAAPQATKQQGQGVGGPGCGTHGRRQSLAGLRGEAPPHTATQAPPMWRASEGPEGQAAVPMGGGGAWPGFETTRPATHSDTSAAGAESAGGSGGPGCGARGRRRGLAGLRDDAPSEARGADGSRAGRRPRAHQAARPSKAHLAGGRARRRPEHQRRHNQREPDTRKPRPADAGRGQPTQSGGKV